MIFPLSVGNTWTYRESVSCFDDGAPWDRIQERRDRITGLVRFKGQDFNLLDRGTLWNYLLRVEGESVLYVSVRDTGLWPHSGLYDRRYESLPWTAFDFTLGRDSSRVLFAVDTTYTIGYENMLYIARDHGDTIISVPAGRYDAHHIEVEFSVNQSGQTWSSRTEESMHYFIAEGVGIVKEIGHHDHDDLDPGTSSNCYWTAELTSYKLMK
jgi:hypothetical protein